MPNPMPSPMSIPMSSPMSSDLALFTRNPFGRRCNQKKKSFFDKTIPFEWIPKLSRSKTFHLNLCRESLAKILNFFWNSQLRHTHWLQVVAERIRELCLSPALICKWLGNCTMWLDRLRFEVRLTQFFFGFSHATGPLWAMWIRQYWTIKTTNNARNFLFAVHSSSFNMQIPGSLPRILISSECIRSLASFLGRT